MDAEARQALQDRVASPEATDRDRAEWNALAWLEMTDEELIRCSASLGLSPDLHPEGAVAMLSGPEPGLVAVESGGQRATVGQLAELRARADERAADHADKKFVKSWVKEHRKPPSKDDYVPLS